MAELDTLLRSTHICSYPVIDPTARTWRKLGVPGTRFANFRLIGRTTEFCVVAFCDCAGIACVHGITFDGKYQTTARVVDVIPM